MKVIAVIALVGFLYASCFCDLKTPYIAAGAALFVACYTFYLTKRIL